MATESESLGACPECGASVPRGAVLVEYEREGARVAYAECPDCVEPVRPR
ncbi:hypothetical protein [Halobacterium sp. CBA1126]|nr:hypothetical protein [Halobacterium sp. CBA1126]